MRRSSCSEGFLTADEVAALFRLPSRRAVFDRVRRGTIPTPFRLGHRTLLWERAEVMRFIENNRVEASTAGAEEGGGR